MTANIVLNFYHRQPMSREDKEAQEDELLALASIYPEDEFKRSETAPGGEICICLDLPPNFNVAIKGDSASNEYMGSFEGIVSFLPPIILNFELPPGYPSTKPPAFKLSCKWLSPSQLAQLCQRLDDLWEEYAGGVVLFAWMQFLKEQTLEYLNINSPYEIPVCVFESQSIKNNLGECDTCSATGPAQAEIWDNRAIQDVESVSGLIESILDFNEAQQKTCFDSKTYMCNICFSEKLGSECTSFKNCEHVYCNECLKDYYTVQIQDGQVQALNCPEQKCPSVASPAQVKVLVGEELFSRYDQKLLLLRDEYAEADEAGKRMLERRYGKNVITKAIEMKSFEWLQMNTKQCPSCKANVQKVDGCNRMCCARCKEHFCWLCFSVLSKEDPYNHFSNRLSTCYNR
ncbi:hypothetical protein XELAEV_18017178mg [Xenopus laevis]|uniref:E3 ubiquitin-protein ligase RNF14 n=1 Tax=Xenopus laevis TaxID=8355 RepID=A0A974HSE9_XENLA|nr:hypothetical protein XELAEV_18017178mg [Xenopus laevis]